MGKNKPEPIERKHYFVYVHVKQTAATMLTLLEILPHILGKKVSSDDTKWQNFLNLIQITFLCLTPYISLETDMDLRNLIETHLQSFRRLPKSHISSKNAFFVTYGKANAEFWAWKASVVHAI